MSPEVGQLDERAMHDAFIEDPDAALSLLTDLVTASDPQLRELARRLAGRIVVDLARRGAPARRGAGRLSIVPLDELGADLDLDASLDRLVEARSRDGTPNLADLRARGWRRPGTAWTLIVDRSGSMGGERLAAAAVAAAALSWRSPADYSVVAFSADAVVVKSQDAPEPPERVVNDVLALRGHGTTDLTLGLRVAADQLARSRAGRRIAVLLSDCRATVPGDVESAARRFEELIVVPPVGDQLEAEALARAVGARCIPLAGPSSVPAMFAALQ